jgi:hypothetical protein
MLRLFASINQQHSLFSNAKLFILIIKSDRKIQMIGDSQASESATSTLIGMNPEKGRWIFVAPALPRTFVGAAYTRGVFFGRPLHKLWSIDATQFIAIYLVSSVFRPFDAFSGGP